MSQTSATKTQTSVPPEVQHSNPSGFRRERLFHLQMLLLGDLGMGLLSFWLAVELRSYLPHIHGRVTPTTAIVSLLLFAGALLLSYFRRPQHRSLRVGTFFSSIIMALICILSILFLARVEGQQVSRPILLIFSAIAALTLEIWHGLLAPHLSRYSKQNPCRLIVSGEPQRVQVLSSQLNRFERIRVTELTCADPQSAASIHQTLNRIGQYLRTHPVDTILLAPDPLAMTPALSELYRGIIQLCEQTGTELCIDANWLDSSVHVELDHIGTSPVIAFSFNAARAWALLCKRLIDICLSSVLLVVLSPVLLLVALAIKMDSPGTVIFKQTRCGLRGRLFVIYKFRSMVVEAESLKSKLLSHNEMSGPIFKMSFDPRVTRVGYWLRRTSLDEIPQLFNVLRGDMSLVGPRPPLPSEVQEYRTTFFRRLGMKPGITGLWQVSGRNQIQSFQQWVELDNYYISSWSLFLDFKIMLKTIWVVLKLTGK